MITSAPVGESLASTNQRASTKARGFVVDKKTSQPLKGVIVLAVLEYTPSGSSQQGFAIPLGMLASDTAGYVSFDVTNSIGLAATSQSVHLWVYPLRAEQSKQDVMTQLTGGFQFLIQVDAALSSPSVAGLPAIQNPDYLDWQISPHSFSARVELVLGEDDCQVPVPSTVAERELGLSRVVRRTPMTDPNTDNTTNLVNVLDTIKTGTPQLEFGDILEFRQKWFPLTHSLGQVIYSLPLAPCESVDLALIDWSRQDTLVRQDTVVETESLLHDQRRDRSIDDTVAAALHESQGGWSLLGGIGGSISAPVDGMKIGAADSFGGGISQTWGNRDVTASSLQEIHDHVTQATSVVRTLNSTVIVQSTQKESNVVQTRTVTNHNHCHALTMQYYEVLRNFKVVTEFVRKRPIVLVPYGLVSFDTKSWGTALRFRTILAEVLLDPRLADCFDAIVRLHLCPDVYPKTSPPAPAHSPVAVHLGTWDVATGLVKTGQTISKGDSLQFTSSGNVNFGGDVTHGLIYTADGRDEIADNQHGYFAPGLKEYSLVFKIGTSPWIQGGATMTYVSKDYEGLLVMIPNGDTRISGDTGNWSVDIDNTPAAGTSGGGGNTPPATGPNKADDQCCEARLLSHLSANVGYYNRAIWVLQDPVERRLLVENSLAKHPAIKFGFDDQPVAVSGNYVAFPYNDPNAGDPQVPPQPQVSIMSLPTRGVFLEAQLGNCNACETRDVTRFWQWDESPCAPPPVIQGITPGPKGQPDTVQPATLPSAVVQISQPLAEPNPVGLAAALNLLGQPNIFRDMSGMAQVGQLLDGLVAGTTSLAQAKGLAQSAKQQLSSAGAGGLLGGSGGNGATRPQSASDLNDKLQVVSNAKDRGLLTNTAAQDAARQYFKSDTTPVNSAGAAGIIQTGYSPGTTGSVTRPSAGMKEAGKKLLDWGAKLGTAVLASDEDHLGQALSDAAVEIAKSEISKAVSALPFAKVLQLTLRYSLVFADGVGTIIDSSHEQIQRIVDEAARFSDEGLSQADVARLMKARSWLALGWQKVPDALEAGLEAVVTVLLAQAQGILKEAANEVTTTITSEVAAKLLNLSKVDRIYLAAATKVGNDVPGARLEMYSELAAKLVRQLIATVAGTPAQRTRIEALLPATASEPAPVAILRGLLELALVDAANYVDPLAEVLADIKDDATRIRLSFLISYEAKRAAHSVIEELKAAGWTFGSYSGAIEPQVDLVAKTINLPDAHHAELELGGAALSLPPGEVSMLEADLSTDDAALASVADGLDSGVVIRSADYQADIDLAIGDAWAAKMDEGIVRTQDDAAEATSSMFALVGALTQRYTGTEVESEARAALHAISFPPAQFRVPGRAIQTV